MKIEEFIAQWAQITPTTEAITIPLGMEEAPDLKVTMDGNLMNTRTNHCYSWSCNPNCLFFKDTLVCYRFNGIILTNETFQKQLRDPFEKLGIISYLFSNDISEFESLFNKALAAFCRCANSGRVVDPVILRLMNKFNITYENKYLNYCRKVDATQFLEMTKKHASRQKHEKKVEMNGLWKVIDY